MLIDFNELQEMTIPGMNNGTGTMTARMYNDDSYRIIPTTLHPGGSIGEHTQDSGDDMNFILSGSGSFPWITSRLHPRTTWIWPERE